MHEDVIRSCFMEAYKLLTENEGEKFDEFVNILKKAISDKSPSQMRAKYETEREAIQKKISKLVDLFVEEKIDQTAFDKKRIAFENKKDELDKKISQLSNYEIDSSKIELSIDKIKYELQSRDMNNEPQLFDTGIFTQLIDYGIIGGINELGKKEPYMIRFICRKGFNSTSRGDITE